ncbi:hypothetical protein CROQUDRAFT_131808 [Cronartium quercuum f. sp. fusiforme G11]|uniref:Cryptic loci regulator 2 C-terminal domain-containing protein n=1 Tax=Cronartium quercuum f. sp. fusiforme G11 TaxID=708437 RepID=A0A9P6NK99_9BASI|nr:hypothetical protein CROQUDRAFT_131808 [Cronartium quercuum f. sp. fusiforme G11]
MPSSRADPLETTTTDIEQRLSYETMSNGSPYRVYELVWVILHKHATPLPTRVWPGIILERRTNQKTIDVIELLDSEDDAAQTVKRPTSHTRVVKTFYWRVELLGLSNKISVKDAEILPWLEHRINPNEWNTLRIENGPIPKCLFEPKSRAPSLSDILDPALARLFFQLALQLASEIEQQGGLGTVKIFPPVSLVKNQDEIKASYKFSATDSKPNSRYPFAGNGFTYDHIWFGAEMINVGDMVRLAPLPLPLHKHNQITRHHKPIANLFLRVSHLCSPSDKLDIHLYGSVYDLVSIRPFRKTSKHKPACACYDLSRVLEQKIIPNVSIQDQRQDRYLPSPPKGYTFRLLTPPTKVNALTWDCVAGRWYPSSSINPSAFISKTELGLNKIMKYVHN